MSLATIIPLGIASALALFLILEFARESAYIRGMSDGEQGAKMGSSHRMLNPLDWIFMRRYVKGHQYGAHTRELRASGVMKERRSWF